MKKILALGLSLVALMATASPALAAIRIDFGNNFHTAVVSRDSDARLRMLNETLYPDTPAVASEWLCDGVAVCVELPGADATARSESALTIDYEIVLRNDNRRIT